MCQPSEREWIIALHGYHDIPEPAAVFSDFDRIVVEIMRKFELRLSHAAIEGDDYSGKIAKASGAAYKRAFESGFSEVEVLHLLSNPSGSNNPAYDRFLSASLTITPKNDNLLTFCVNDGIVEFGNTDFLRILEFLSNLCDWTTGYAFADLITKKPEFHAMGLDDGRLSTEESDQLTKWYCSKRNDKVSRIRSIYPFNLLNASQLEQRLENGRTLRHFVEEHGASHLSTQAYGGLTLWEVPEDEVVILRSIFDDSSILIS